MKANIEKVLKEIGNNRKSLEELVVMFGEDKDYESKSIEDLKSVLRISIKEHNKEKFIQMCMGIGVIEYDENRISDY